MQDEYDFSNAKKNPYAKQFKRQVTINLNADAIEYFKAESASSGIPYQVLINLYLCDCAAKKRKLTLCWE